MWPVLHLCPLTVQVYLLELSEEQILPTPKLIQKLPSMDLYVTVLHGPAP